jgi:hypothetical protein
LEYNIPFLVAAMPEKIQVFGRSEVADIVGLEYAVVKNWSNGKPITIEPSIEAPGRRGAKSLYNRTDVYLFALAKHLSELGFALEAVERAFRGVEEAWLMASERGGLILARLNTDRPLVAHVSGRLPKSQYQIEYARLVMPLIFDKATTFHVVVHLGAVLDAIDKRIAEVKGHTR